MHSHMFTDYKADSAEVTSSVKENVTEGEIKPIARERTKLVNMYLLIHPFAYLVIFYSFSDPDISPLD